MLGVSLLLPLLILDERLGRAEAALLAAQQHQPPPAYSKLMEPRHGQG